MTAKPMKTLELHFPMIQFLIISDIPQLRLGNIQSLDVFKPIARERKDLMDYKLGYLSANIIPRSEQFSESTARGNCEIRGTNNVQGQTSDIFPRQMEAFVFILQMFIATRVVLKIGGIFGHMTCLDQSRANEYI